MHAKYEVSIFYGLKVIANVKVDNRQTNRQDKNNMPPDHSIRGHQNGRKLALIMSLWNRAEIVYGLTYYSNQQSRSYLFTVCKGILYLLL